MKEFFRKKKPKADIELSDKNRPPIKDLSWCIFRTGNHLTVWKQITNIR